MKRFVEAQSNQDGFWRPFDTITMRALAGEVYETRAEAQRRVDHHNKMNETNRNYLDEE